MASTFVAKVQPPRTTATTAPRAASALAITPPQPSAGSASTSGAVRLQPGAGKGSSSSSERVPAVKSAFFVSPPLLPPSLLPPSAPAAGVVMHRLSKWRYGPKVAATASKLGAGGAVSTVSPALSLTVMETA